MIDLVGELLNTIAPVGINEVVLNSTEYTLNASKKTQKMSF